MRALLALTLVVLCAFNGRAQNSLEPCKGVFSIDHEEYGYYALIKEKLFDGLSDTPGARLIILPSFESERVMDIDYDTLSSKYYATVHIANGSIWGVANKENVTINKFRREISPESAQTLFEIYERAIYLSQPCEYVRGGLDGTSYYFMRWSTGMQCATTWSPDKASVLGRLIDINDEIIKSVISQTGVISFNTSLQDNIQAVMAQLVPDYKEAEKGYMIPDGFMVSAKMLNESERVKKLSDSKQIWIGADLVFSFDNNMQEKAAYLLNSDYLVEPFVREIQQGIDAIVIPGKRMRIDYKAMGFSQGNYPKKLYYT
ncbi:MAG: hypothetical protein EOO92_26265, partial [Pedobacter sp.]